MAYDKNDYDRIEEKIEELTSKLIGGTRSSKDQIRDVSVSRERLLDVVIGLQRLREWVQGLSAVHKEGMEDEFPHHRPFPPTSEQVDLFLSKMKGRWLYSKCEGDTPSELEVVIDDKGGYYEEGKPKYNLTLLFMSDSTKPLEMAKIREITEMVRQIEILTFVDDNHITGFIKHSGVQIQYDRAEVKEE